MGYILVTGAAGYIGAVTCQVLLENRFDIIGIDNYSNGFLQDPPDHIKFFPIDIGDKVALEHLFSNFPVFAVIHLAGFSVVGDSLIYPRDYFHNNLTKTLNLLDSMVDHKVNRIVFASSAAVYGNACFSRLSEDSSLNPSNPYGVSKLTTESILNFYSVAYGLKSVSLRYFNVMGSYGKYGEIHRPETHLIPNIIQSGISGDNPFSIFGRDFPTTDGTAIRDYVHVQDVALANIQALDALSYLTQGAYNVGTGQGHSILEIVRLVEKILKISLPINYLPKREGDPAVLISDPTAIRRDIHWEPNHTNLEEMLFDAVSWHKSK